MKINIINTGRLLLLFIVLIFSGQKANARINGVHSLDGVCVDPSGYEYKVSPPRDFNITLTPAASCYVDSQGYVPHAGNYTIALALIDYKKNYTLAEAETNPFSLNATQNLSQQSVSTWGGQRVYDAPPNTTIVICQWLVDQSTGDRYMVSDAEKAYLACESGTKPLPPSPPVPDTTCTLNNGNDLNMNLGTIDRSQMPTVPGSGSMRHIPVPVECTGGDVTVNMQLNYTPISLSAGEVIKSSSNGLGVSVVYDSKILSSTDITPVTFTAGSNSIDLAFQAVRDPTVEIKDVPTGAFTASAVLVMTQQ